MKYVITGSNGRMGKSLLSILMEDSQDVVSVHRKSILNEVSTDKNSMVIDFSSPDYFTKILDWSVEKKVNFVSGTTGLQDSHFAKLKEASKVIPCLWAPNMSVGVAFVNKLLKMYSSISDEFDFQIEDFHHKHKIDAPSGTGILLQDSLKKAVDKPLPDILSVRGGGIFGVHKIWAMSKDETILLEHQALNRDVFSRGAIKCAKWLNGKRPGLYKISDVVEG